jgi:hypothetical protein
MKKLYIFAAIFLAAFYFLFAFLKKEPPAKNTLVAFDEAGADGPAEALQFEILKTKDPITGEVPREKLDLARAVQLQRFARQKRTGRETTVPGINWTERGPDNVGGRTRAILYDLNDPTGKKVWAGGVGGGLWFTNDITANPPAWTKVSDTLNNLAITCITQGKGFTLRNKLFFGTGEGWLNPDAIRGNGIWRSLDGGAHWVQLPFTKNNPDFRFVQDIVYVDLGPCSITPEGLLASTSRGVFRSTDNGDSWTKVLGAGIAGASIDAAADLEQEYYYVFASLGLAHTGGGGIYRSCDGGATWQEIYHAANDEQRIELSAHYLDGWQLYAVVQDNSFKAKKIMKSPNADTTPGSATTWITKTLPSFCNLSGATEFTNGQAWYDLIISVAPFFRTPTNSHYATVYVGGVDLNKSTDSGGTWSQVSEWYTGCSKPYAHADKHNLVFKPDQMNAAFFPNEFLLASDGGVAMSTDGGASYTTKNKTYNITQFYSCAFHPTLTNYFLAGSQDNSTQKFSSPDMNSTTNIVAYDSDGGYCFIDQDNPGIQIATYTRNRFFISTNGGTSFTYTSKNERGQFINPMDYDNANNILYAGDDAGNYYRWTDPAGGGADQQVSVMAFNGAKLTFVLVSPTVANRVYFGLDNGSVVRVDDANTGSSKTGVVIRPDLGSNVFLSCIAIDPANENHMLISYSGYNMVSVYESSLGTGGGLNWNEVDVDGSSSSLPDMPVRWCMFDPRNSDWAILATEMGVWSTDNLNGAATVWEPTNNNLANTRIDMLRYRGSDRLLLAATHGRGLFSTTIPAGSSLPVTLLEFTGRLHDNEVWLNWSTSSEYNSKTFELERSNDGLNYAKIGSVPAAGNTSTKSSYSFHDSYLSQQNNYYRLKQIDMDGKSEYSRVVMIKNPIRTKAALTLLTNPFTNAIDLQFGTLPKGRSQISLYDMKGALILRKFYNIEPATRLRVDINKPIAGGQYFLEVLVENERHTARLIKN